VEEAVGVMVGSELNESSREGHQPHGRHEQGHGQSVKGRDYPPLHSTH